jgi:RHS repeat-associated protein
MTQCVFGANTSSFVYGADGLRRRSTVNATVTDYVLDGQSATRTIQNGAAAETFLTGPRGSEYQRAGNNAAVWYLYDGLGSVFGTVDGSGNIISTRKFDVYGAVRDSTGPSGTRDKFCGALGHPSEDETGLLDMRARFMDPVTGRFSSEDPSKDGTNWYSYAAGNPVGNADYDGRIVAGWLALLLAAGAFALGLYLGQQLGYRFADRVLLRAWGPLYQGSTNDALALLWAEGSFAPSAIAALKMAGLGRGIGFGLLFNKYLVNAFVIGFALGFLLGEMQALSEYDAYARNILRRE